MHRVFRCCLVLVAVLWLAQAATNETKTGEKPAYSAQNTIYENLAAVPELSIFNSLLAELPWASDFYRALNGSNPSDQLQEQQPESGIDLQQTNATNATKATDVTKHVTLFAPSNSAFAALDLDSIEHDYLLDTLRYHVLPKSVSSQDINGSVTWYPTLLGRGSKYVNLGQNLTQPVGLFKDRRGRILVSAGKLRHGHPHWTRVQRGDLNSSNGVIHVVDSVFTIPESFDLTARERGLQPARHAFILGGVGKTLQDAAGITVFAPSSRSLLRIARQQRKALSNPNSEFSKNFNFTKAVECLHGSANNHIVNGVYLSSDLANGQELSTYGNDTLVVSSKEKPETPRAIKPFGDTAAEGVSYTTLDHRDVHFDEDDDNDDDDDDFDDDYDDDHLPRSPWSINGSALLVPDVLLSNGVLHIVSKPVYDASKNRTQPRYVRGYIPAGLVSQSCKDNTKCGANDSCCDFVDSANKTNSSVCYDPNTHVCTDHFLCPVNASQACGGACYSLSAYVCLEGNFLCPTIAPNKCGDACYAETEYNCTNGNLTQITYDDEDDEDEVVAPYYRKRAAKGKKAPLAQIDLDTVEGAVGQAQRDAAKEFGRARRAAASELRGIQRDLQPRLDRYGRQASETAKRYEKTFDRARSTYGRQFDDLRRQFGSAERDARRYAENQFRTARPNIDRAADQAKRTVSDAVDQAKRTRISIGTTGKSASKQASARADRAGDALNRLIDAVKP